MTNLPDDQIDRAEARLARRVHDYTEPAVVPVDPARIAATAILRGGPRRAGASRVSWLFAGAALAAGVAAVVLLFKPAPPTNVGDATPTASVASIEGCTAGALEATVGSWEGAAGHRIGTITVTNQAGVACILSGAPVPSLIDRNGKALLVGKIQDAPGYQLAAGASVQALVQTGNYCGPTAQEPAAVALDFGALGRIVAKPVEGGDLSGVPPCMGDSSPNDDITMQPWGAAAQG